MSGFETLAQVYRELAAPKLKNLKITATIVCTYAAVSTGIITILASMIIPNAVRRNYVENLLGGLAMHLAGPELLRLVFHVFVVIVGILILSGAVNTSIIGANGVMNRVAEDLTGWDESEARGRPLGEVFHIVNEDSGAVADPVGMLERVRGWLEPGTGRIFAAVPNARSIHRQAAVIMGLLPQEDALNDRDRHHGQRDLPPGRYAHDAHRSREGKPPPQVRRRY